jgi:hypothetical protein
LQAMRLVQENTESMAERTASHAISDAGFAAFGCCP